jgi:hypothetical protein
MSEPADEFRDVRSVVGQTVKWEYTRILRPEIVLNDNQGRRLMVFRRRHLFSTRRTQVYWLHAESYHIDVELTGPLWLNFVPFVGRKIGDSYKLVDVAGKVLASTTDVISNPVAVDVGKNAFYYRRISGRWRHDCVLESEFGEVASGRGGTTEFQILRLVDGLPEALAMYWHLRLCDWDGYEG